MAKRINEGHIWGGGTHVRGTQVSDTQVRGTQEVHALEATQAGCVQVSATYHETKQHDRVRPHVSGFHRGVLQHFDLLKRQPLSFATGVGMHSKLHVGAGHVGLFLAATNPRHDQFPRQPAGHPPAAAEGD